MLNFHLIESSFYSLIIFGLIIKLFLNYLNLRHIQFHQNSVPTRFVQLISLTDHQKAAEYTKDKLLFSSFNTIVSYSVLMFWMYFSGLAWLDQLVALSTNNVLLRGMLFVALFATLNFIIELPLGLYYTFVIEQKHGFNKSTAKIYFFDTFKMIILSLILGGILLAVIISLMEHVPDWWWLLSWIFVTTFQIFMLWAYPVFIAPLFNRFEKLNNIDLKEEIDALLVRSDLKFKDYFVMNASLRSAHGNAYFTGIGKNRRIVFFDTLLNKLENAEIIAVLAHELGHLKHHHIRKSLIISFFVTGGVLMCMQWLWRPEFFSLFKTQASSYMLLILFSLMMPVYTFPLTPIFSFLSRKKEFEADHFAVKKSNGDALCQALIKLHRDNSTFLSPSPIYSKFYYSHPPANERIEYIKSLEVN